MTKDNNITPYTIRVFPSRQLLHESFFVELRDMINVSFRDQALNPLGKVGLRLDTERQLVDELGPNGITVIAFDQGKVVGTASVKPWVSDKETWKPVGEYTNFEAGQVFKSESPFEGDFELSVVAIKAGEQYRKKGMGEILISACEREILANWELTRAPRIMIRTIREFQGQYWLRRGFKVIGEKYCPPSTWDIEKEFILWAMRREIQS
jgi:hypothetical protein